MAKHEISTMNYRDCILDYAEGIEETILMIEADPESYVFEKIRGPMGLILQRYAGSIYPTELPHIQVQCASCLKETKIVAKQTLKKERKLYMREHGNLKNFEEKLTRFQNVKCVYCKGVDHADEIRLQHYRNFCDKYPHLM